MKLSLTLLATTSFCAPERKKQARLTNDRTSMSGPPVPCSTAISDNYWTGEGFRYGGSPYKSVDNGQSGQVTFESYANLVNCYVDIGSSCSSSGLQIEISHMELEVSTNDNTCYDSIHFEWLNNDGETVEKTDYQCGCIGEDHPSCDDHPFYDWYMAETERPTKYNLVGTDVKFVLWTGLINMGHVKGGKIEVDWKCNKPITAPTSSNSVTNILTMAEALLTGNFTPEMGRDYGCAGRGLFDPFAQTIGKHVDAVDAAFFVWKKCVQCASDKDKSNVLAYSYDVESDTCGKKIENVKILN